MEFSKVACSELTNALCSESHIGTFDPWLQLLLLVSPTIHVSPGAPGPCACRATWACSAGPKPCYVFSHWRATQVRWLPCRELLMFSRPVQGACFQSPVQHRGQRTVWVVAPLQASKVLLPVDLGVEGRGMRWWCLACHFMLSCFFSDLLKYNWYITLYKFKMTDVMIWYAYMLWNDYHNRVS